MAYTTFSIFKRATANKATGKAIVKYCARFHDDDGVIVKTKALKATTPSNAAIEAKAMLAPELEARCLTPGWPRTLTLVSCLTFSIPLKQADTLCPADALSWNDVFCHNLPATLFTLYKKPDDMVCYQQISALAISQLQIYPSMVTSTA